MKIPCILSDGDKPEAEITEDLVFDLPIKPPKEADEFIKKNGEKYTITVNKGFITDFASSPKWAWSFVGPLGKYTSVAVLHDYLYYYQIGNRKWADDLFLEHMKRADVAWVRRHLMYWAVRLKGKRVWDET